ncbi:hypothetical protein A3F37_01350 [Candidatus Saccharibacteria bacterium RIFCSPHIGHO2_12_FULL_41_12]|nr:MAG: hypothetical protein A3F37_01350 [Candidatus Saccharibacteria bacterium RIFCSPHIGHO2_12_FULL_41_12]
MKIRKATIEDLKAVQDLSFKLFKNDESWVSHLRMDWTFEDEGIKYFTSRLNGKEGIAYVAEDNNRIVGYITGDMKKDVSWRSVRIAELENIFIEEESRHKNMGKKLFGEFRIWAREQEAQKLMVSASYPNTSAIEFYKSVGFEPYSLELEMGMEGE